MGRFDTGRENSVDSAISSPAIQVQTQATSTGEWEGMGKNGNEREKSAPVSPNGSPHRNSPPGADAAEADAETSYPELVRGLLEFLGASEPGPDDSVKRITPLTPRQISALPYLAAFPNANQAARAAGIGKSTLYRWLEDDNFRDTLTRLREESAEFARQELKGNMLRAVDVFREGMNNGDINIRLRAARYSMSFSNEVGLAEKLRKEVEHLETAVDQWQSRRPVP